MLPSLARAQTKLHRSQPMEAADTHRSVSVISVPFGG